MLSERCGACGKPVRRHDKRRKYGDTRGVILARHAKIKKGAAKKP